MIHVDVNRLLVYKKELGNQIKHTFTDHETGTIFLVYSTVLLNCYMVKFDLELIRIIKGHLKAWVRRDGNQ